MEALRREGVEILDATIAVLGYAYLENSDDTRNSPSQLLVARLQELGARVTVHDPYVRPYQGELLESIRGSDAVVVMVAHDQYRDLDLGALRAHVAGPILIDGRYVFSAQQARAAGWAHYGVGSGPVSA